jgi:hypothetical protein
LCIVQYIKYHSFKTRPIQDWNRAELKKKQGKKKQGKKKPGVTRQNQVKNPVATR